MSTPSTSNHAARLAARRAADASERDGAAPAGRPIPRKGKPDAARWAKLNATVDVRLRDLGDAELRAWLVLFRDERGGVARAGMGDIARRAGLSRRAVVKAIGRLKDRGLVEITARGTVGGLPNTYRLTIPT